ncbi:acylphosphatase [Sphingomonas sp.]|uniref:acylphosphatase n=1 Tax=Sphingomonas sp. TaxID=28214 RepID=UPI003D6CE0B0
MASTQRVFISGKVQHIGFRDWIVRKAHDNGVTGWVRNLRDGRVEMLVIGEADDVTAFLDACRQGPELARIDSLEARPDTERAPKGFTKRFTA